MAKGNQIKQKRAAAVIPTMCGGQIIMADTDVPRGTLLESTSVSDTRVLFTFKVLWWALPYYLYRAVRDSLVEGMSINKYEDRTDIKPRTETPMHRVKDMAPNARMH